MAENLVNDAEQGFLDYNNLDAEFKRLTEKLWLKIYRLRVADSMIAMVGEISRKLREGEKVLLNRCSKDSPATYIIPGCLVSYEDSDGSSKSEDIGLYVSSVTKHPDVAKPVFDALKKEFAIRGLIEERL